MLTPNGRYWLQELIEAQKAWDDLYDIKQRYKNRSTKASLFRAMCSLCGDVSRYAEHLRDNGGLLFLRWSE